jgi:hypothetical protein
MISFTFCSTVDAMTLSSLSRSRADHM